MWDGKIGTNGNNNKYPFAPYGKLRNITITTYGTNGFTYCRPKIRRTI